MLRAAAWVAALAYAGALHAAEPASPRKDSATLSKVAELVNPSVVVIDVTGRETNADGAAVVSRSTGTGVLWSADGDIVTAAHVLEGALAVSVRLYDGRRFPGRLLGRDMATDLAVLHVDATQLPAARLGSSVALSQGDSLLAIGAPFGLSYSLSAGVLSAKGRGGIGANAIEDYLQTDAALNPGNSGGPLCDLQGRVVGINAMVVADTRGIGFAVPVEMAQVVAAELRAHGRVSRPWLGVDFQDLTPDLAEAMGAQSYMGVLLGSVRDPGPGASAKLAPGDVLVRFAGRPLRSGRDLVAALTELRPRQSVQAEVWRKGALYQTTLVLGERPEAPASPLPMERPSPELGLGLYVRAAEKTQTAGRVRIDRVALGTAADRAALKKGDLIVEANGKALPTVAEVNAALLHGAVLLHVSRGERSFWVALHR